MFRVQKLNYAKTKYQQAQAAKRALQHCINCGFPNQPHNLDARGICNQCNSNKYTSNYAATRGRSHVAYTKRNYPGNVSTPYRGQVAQQPQCSFTWDVPRQAYAVTAEYQPNFIEFIKAKVPGSNRVAEFDSITRKFKCWYIKEAWFDVLHELASQLWPGAVHVLSKINAERAWKMQEDARLAAIAAQRAAVLGPFESALLNFCTLCDVDALRAARNKMAIALHPDKGGDPEKMARLNASWFLIEQEFKKQK